MARKGRSMKNYRKLPYVVSSSLGTLASSVVIGASVGGTIHGRTKVTSCEATYGVFGLTAGEGPLIVGVAHGDYSATEIKECLEALASWDPVDRVAGEQADRLVRQIGQFDGESTDEVLNDGKPIKTKLNWTLEEGATFQLFIYNRSGATLTTGAQMSTNGHLNSFSI